MRRRSAGLCFHVHLAGVRLYFVAEADGAGNCGNPLGSEDGNPLGNADGNPLGNVFGKLLGKVEGITKGLVAGAPPSVTATITTPPSGSFFGAT